MPAVAFDTHRYVKRLEEAGVPEKQAEAQAEVLSETMSLNLDKLATKDDIKDMATKADLAEVRSAIEGLRVATKADIEGLRVATKADQAEVRSDIEGLRVATKTDIEGLRVATKADLRTEVVRIEGRFTLLQWMIGFNLAFTMVILWKIFS